MRPLRPTSLLCAAVLGLGTTLMAGTAPATATAAGTVTIASPALAVQVDTAFPRVVQYTDQATGAVLYGNEDPLTQVSLNGSAQTPTVTSSVAADHVDYTMAFANGDTVKATLSVSGSALTFAVTSIADSAVPVTSLSIPQHNLVSVRSSQPGAAVETTRMNTNTTGTGDTFTPLTSTAAADTAPQGAMYAILNTGSLAASIATNSYYDSPSGQNAADSGRIQKQTVAKSGYRRAGLWSGDWLHRAAGAPGTEPLPYAKVVVTGDRNADTTVDWQDGAIAFRSIMTSPQGWQDTARRVVQRIPYNFASQATHPFLQTLDETKRVARATDGLGQFVLLKGYGSEGHDSAHPDYGLVGTRQGGAADLNTLIAAGAGYNADIGVHINDTEAYPVARSFDPALLNNGGADKGWDYLDQSYHLNYRLDGTSGKRLARLQELKAVAPDLKFLYVDTWYGDGYTSQALAREINGLGYQLTTEFPDKFEDQSLWSHWANDLNYGGSNYKGVNSQVARFIRNQQRDDWIAGDPLLGGGTLTAYEGWQGTKDFTNFLTTTFTTNLPTKYLQGFTIRKWAANRIDFDGGVSATLSGTTRTISKDGHPVLIGDTYLLPWNQGGESKLYHWSGTGGASTWNVPASWAQNGTAKLYRLTDQGRVLVGDLPVTAGKVTLTATAKTPYVVYPSAAPAQADAGFGEGGPVRDPGFTSGDLSKWTVTGSASVTRNAVGQSQLTIGQGATTVAQQLNGLTPGTYAASAYVSTATGRTATLAVAPAGAAEQSAYATSSPYRNNVGADEKNGSTMQRMRVLFDVPAGQSTATLALRADGAAGTAAFDDVRVVRTARSPQGGHTFAEDFENVDSGWYPFVVGPAGGSTADPRTHIAQRNAPYTQAGWNGKLIDDVLSGANSLKSHEERPGLLYQTIPQTLRFEPGHQYKVTFAYQQSVAGDYAFTLGAGTGQVSSDTLPQARTTNTFTKTFTAGVDAWIGMRKLTAETSDSDRDLVVDDLTVDDLGATLSPDLALNRPTTASSVQSADYPATAATDGSPTSRWSSAFAADPQWIQVDLGSVKNVNRVVLNWEVAYGRAYKVQLSDDGTTWRDAYSTTTSDGGTDELTGLNGSGRYLRVTGTQRATGYGYSLWAVEAYS
ncbi:endo-alpha-N-acetylgalactosaminidase family protein [Streptomyces sp. NPDC058401]|uniref:endo-alpha-N-acetylgalactosaminidase family protein n=1 Tax=Streptomyces sp. NPDC058401 TaxID=3346480 RepID=UPI00365E493A